MDADPAVPLPRVVRVFAPGSLELWRAALDRPEADVQTQAAVTIASAHERGMPGLAGTAGALRQTLDKPGQFAAVKVAAARALATLDAKDAAPSLLTHSRGGDADFRAVAEPALARWKHPPAADYWLERLAEPPPYGRGTVLAMRGLAALPEARAAGPLLKLVRSAEVPAATRVEAARAVGVIQPVGLTVEAGNLFGSGGRTERLCAVWLLRWHSGEVAELALSRFTADPEPAVAGPAADRLFELNPNHAANNADDLLASRGAEVRAVAVAALIRVPTVDRVRTLADRLSDPHPAVRSLARKGLRQLADRPNLRAAVVADGVRVLAGSDWRGQEQAAVLLAQLDHKPAAERFVELLKADRGEPTVAAAWGLRVLAVKETLPAVLAHVQNTEKGLRKEWPSEDALYRRMPRHLVDRQMCQLVQFLARADHRPAEETFVGLVPRGVRPFFTAIGPQTRAAAIWGLGRFHAGKPDVDLVGLIEGRLTGDPGLGQDRPEVRRMAAVALGLMKAESSLKALDVYTSRETPTADPVAHACRWAEAAITGRKLEPPGPFEVLQRDPFLSPAK